MNVVQNELSRSIVIMLNILFIIIISIIKL